MRIPLGHDGLCAAADTRGGELVSFRDRGGTEYIWGGDPAYWAGRNPILFPFVGTLKNGAVRFGGRESQMPRHGFARHSEFDVAERGEDYVLLALRDSPETLAQYPFPFLLKVRHQLTGDGFLTRFEVENTGDGPLPFCIGAHTAFRCPLFAGETFEDYRLVFDQVEDARSLALTPEGCLSPAGRGPGLEHTDVMALDHAVYDRVDTLIFENLRSTAVSLRHKDTGRGVRVEFPGFPMLAFWTKPGAAAPYICIEPWHGCAALDDESGEFSDKPHCITLDPGERTALEYTVTPV